MGRVYWTTARPGRQGSRYVSCLPDETLLLPYGWWTCADGSVVLFDRLYQPMFERLPSGEVHAVDPNEWVHFIKQEWFSTADPSLRKRHDPDVQYRLGEILDEFRFGEVVKSIKARAIILGKQKEKTND